MLERGPNAPRIRESSSLSRIDGPHVNIFELAVQENSPPARTDGVSSGNVLPPYSVMRDKSQARDE